MHARTLGRQLALARRRAGRTGRTGRAGRAGLSCAQVAAALGWPPTQLRLLETGHGLTLALLQQLAAFYGLTVGALLSGVPPRPSRSSDVL